MGIKYIKGDALDWAEKEGYCMIHVCNAQGKMGSGIAKQVKERFPAAYNNYLDNHTLGSVTSDKVFLDNPSVINLVGQEYYGYDGARYLNYGALAECLNIIKNASKYMEDVKTIVVPWKMGCDRAGGDWEIVKEIVEFMIGETFEILVVKYES